MFIRNALLTVIIILLMLPTGCKEDNNPKKISDINPNINFSKFDKLNIFNNDGKSMFIEDEEIINLFINKCRSLSLIELPTIEERTGEFRYSIKFYTEEDIKLIISVNGSKNIIGFSKERYRIESEDAYIELINLIQDALEG